jgi:hypothetical protein
MLVKTPTTSNTCSGAKGEDTIQFKPPNITALEGSHDIFAHFLDPFADIDTTMNWLVNIHVSGIFPTPFKP